MAHGEVEWKQFRPGISNGWRIGIAFPASTGPTRGG